MKHSDFTTGLSFRTTLGLWRCTDVGTRTIAAIKVGGLGGPTDPTDCQGPPYTIQELVFDENDLPGCSPVT